MEIRPCFLTLMKRIRHPVQERKLKACGNYLYSVGRLKKKKKKKRNKKETKTKEKPTHFF